MYGSLYVAVFELFDQITAEMWKENVLFQTVNLNMGVTTALVDNVSG